MKSREYISENQTAGNEQVGDGIREPRKVVTVVVGWCCVLLILIDITRVNESFTFRKSGSFHLYDFQG